MRIIAPVVAVLVLSAGCSDSNGPGSPGAPSTLKTVSGNAQQATVGSKLASPVVVRAVDAQGRPVSGVAIAFTVLSGNGTVGSASATTNTQGEVSTTWTLGVTADTQRLGAKITTSSSPIADTVLAIALGGLPVNLAIAGDSQAAPPGSALADSIAVTFKDRYGNPAVGDTVIWNVTGGKGSVSPTRSVTNSAGTAKTRWTMGSTLGINSLVASTVGQSLTASFIANAATANPNVHIRILQRPDSASYLGDTLHFSAIATDQNGANIPGAVLAWSTTNAGVATVASSGNLAAIVTSTGNGATHVIASFNGSADTVRVAVQQVPVGIQVVQTAPNVVLGQTIQLVARVVDKGGITVANQAVTWLSKNPSIATINSSGTASGVAVGSVQFQVSSPAVSNAYGVLTVTRVAETALFTQVAVNDNEACGLDTAGELWCWSSSTAPALNGGALQFTQIAAAGGLACGLTTAGATYCWGAEAGNNPILSYGSKPVQISGAPAFVSVAVSGGSVCGLTSSGAAYCWGDNIMGSLGTGNTTSSTTPVAVTGGLTFESLAATCGLLTTGVPYCWGANFNGEVGNGDQSVGTCQVDRITRYPCSPSPIPVAGDYTFTAISVGGANCGLQSNGALYCWGDNSEGELGFGSFTGPTITPTCLVGEACSLVPVLVTGGIQFSAVAAGDGMTCGLDASGHAYCWGYGVQGQLGGGVFTTAAAPTAVVGGLVFTRIAVGNGACGIVAGGKTYCWGPAGTGNANAPVLITP